MTDRRVWLAAVLTATALLAAGCLGDDGTGDEDVADVALSEEPVEVQLIALSSWGGRIDPVEVEVCEASGEPLRTAWTATDCPLSVDEVIAGVTACELELDCPDDPEEDGLFDCAIEVDDDVSCAVSLSGADITAVGGPFDVEVGGAASLAAWWHRDAQRHPGRTWIVSTGDAWGASPPLAAAFAEEPAVRALNAMGIDADTLGNHNFDRGLEHLQSMLDLADYAMLAANLTRVPQNVRGVAPYQIIDLGGLPVAVIGLTDPTSADTVFPGSFGTMTVTEPLEAVLEARELAAASGARMFVVVAHLGTDDDGDDPAPDARPVTPTGPLIDLWLQAQLDSDSAFDLIIGYGTGRNLMCTLSRTDPGAEPQCTDYSAEPRTLEVPTDQSLLVQGRIYGETYPRVLLTMVPETGELTAQRVEFELPGVCGSTDRIDCDARVVATVDEALEPFRAALAEANDVVLGQTQVVLEFDESLLRRTSMPLGSLVADALRVRTDSDVALFNSGGIRDGLPASGYTPRDPTLPRTGAPPLTLVRGDVNAVLPFVPSTVVTVELTVDELFEVIEHSLESSGTGGWAQFSGLDITWAPSAPVGEQLCRVTWTTADDGGEPRVLTRGSSETLQVATVDFLAQGGDGYRILSDKTQITRGALQDTVAEYVQQIAPLTLDDGLSSPRVTSLANGESCSDLDVAP